MDYNRAKFTAKALHPSKPFNFVASAAAYFSIVKSLSGSVSDRKDLNPNIFK